MAQIVTDPSPIRPKSPISKLVSYIFDVRFLGVIGQILFIALLVYGTITIGQNFLSNVDKLGEAQFRCAAGNISFRCAYDFMQGNAGFDISDPVLNYDTTDSFWWAFANGLANTFRVGLLSLVAMTILGTLIGIARLSDNWLVSNISLAYVEIIRNTPILIQLLLIYFSIILALPDIREAAQPFGLPVFLSNRGLSMPWPRLMGSGIYFVLFLIIGLLVAYFLWTVLGKKQLETGTDSKRFIKCLLTIIGFAVVGWFVAFAMGRNSEGLIVSNASGINSFDDIPALVMDRAGVGDASEFEIMSEEAVEAAALQVCVLRDSASEYNLTNKLNRLDIPYDVSRKSSTDRLTSSFSNGQCDVVAAPISELETGLASLDSPASAQIVPIPSNPVTLSVPKFEGFNVIGGWAMRGEFFALFLGLTIFYAGGLAEVVRAGILSVSKGQSEAASALGLVEGQRLSLIVLPQALKVIIPPLISTYLSLMKDTSLGVAVAFPEMYLIAQVLMNQSGRALQIMVLIMLVYLAISIFFSAILNWYNQRVVLVER